MIDLIGFAKDTATQERLVCAGITAPASTDTIRN